MPTAAAAAETLPTTMPTKPVISAACRALVLSHFAGKGLEAATVAIDGVIASLELGEWIPNVSRSARAALSKPAAARAKFRKLCRKELGDDRHYKHAGVSKIAWAFDYGFKYVSNVAKVAPRDLPLAFRDLARDYLDAFTLVDAAFDWLDAMRTLPTFTYLDASPLVTGTLEGLGAVRAFVCPMRFERVAQRGKDGKVHWIPVCILEWPEGTQHGTARWSMYSHQCECCGHGIKARNNWMPMVVQTKDGGHRSLWTGRDCAETLLGVKFTDKLDIQNMPAQKAVK